MRRSDHPEVELCRQSCLPEFSNINHYWDKQRDMVVAKILPGEFYFTTGHIAISTTLGSCISACIWDSKTFIGGMNHFMLPITNKEAHEVNWGKREKMSDATRYGNFAMEHLINTILKSGGRRANLRAKLFGGAKVLNKMTDVGQRNIDFAIHYLKQENIPVESQDIGDIFPRKIIFEPSSGRAFVKRLDNLHNDTITRREYDYRSQIEQDPVDGDVELF
ncbi:chemoreceptor glutamine deamidase CheD [Litorilituus lipolyticus]|uniref:Probable chemoreceptor glutamine deamidase CheD n=1 Tax=Litorilituus lipolyticus TaxID=2491017 RepID=A0A502KR23_9GAMM|nr:chemoreceptor glutamine deamidase CheD [Litorilituus lipolyticus]TPH12749.1 chemoreceptor glutamine deamidase CheD [Litorilituus lipolyticus]